MAEAVQQNQTLSLRISEALRKRLEVVDLLAEPTESLAKIRRKGQA
jgi:hypothetical protein